MLSSKWQGKGILTDPRSSPGYASVMNLMRTTYGDEALVSLGELDWQLADSGTANPQHVAAGSATLGAPTVLSLMTELMDAGAPIDYVVPTPVHTAFVTSGILADAAHPNAAKVFLNWYMSEVGQQIPCEYTMSPTLPGFDCEAMNLPEDRVAATLVSPEDSAQMWNLIGFD